MSIVRRWDVCVLPMNVLWECLIENVSCQLWLVRKGMSVGYTSYGSGFEEE
jgi:hypothetical protein